MSREERFQGRMLEGLHNPCRRLPEQEEAEKKQEQTKEKKVEGSRNPVI